MTNEANYFFGELFRENLSPSRPYSPYWLIVMGGTGPLEVLTISWAGGEETLPVFSSEGEAHVFKRWRRCVPRARKSRSPRWR